MVISTKEKCVRPTKKEGEWPDSGGRGGDMSPLHLLWSLPTSVILSRHNRDLKTNHYIDVAMFWRWWREVTSNILLHRLRNKFWRKVSPCLHQIRKTMQMLALTWQCKIWDACVGETRGQHDFFFFDAGYFFLSRRTRSSRLVTAAATEIRYMITRKLFFLP